MDFYVDMAVAVLLRLLTERSNLTKYRRAMQKVYQEIDMAYNFSGNQIGAKTALDQK